MADDDLGILAGKNFCPQCGTQLQVPGDEEDEHYCNACGWSGDPASVAQQAVNPASGHGAVTGTAPPDDDEDDDLTSGSFPDEPTSWQSGPSYNDYVRNARGKSVDDLFAEAAGRVRPPKPIQTKTDLEEALGTAADAALAQGGSCPFCGADPDKITGGVCGGCGATQPQGVQAWVIGDGEGKTHGACSELCAKVGAAQVDGKVLGQRPWTPPEDAEPECMACGQPLTAVSPSAAPAGTTPTSDQDDVDDNDDAPDVGTEVLR